MFDPFEQPEGGMPVDIAEQREHMSRLMSGLVGDLASLVLVPDAGKSAAGDCTTSDSDAQHSTGSADGGAFGMTMNKPAAADVLQFLTSALSAGANRNSTSYASVLTVMLINERTMGSSQEVFMKATEDAITYIIKTANRAHYEMMAGGSSLDTFLLALVKFQETRPSPLTFSAVDSIGWHNIRYSLTPTAEIFTNGPAYTTISIASVLAVLQKVKLLPEEFKIEDLRAALVMDESCIEGKAKYYDLKNNGWPIAEWAHDGMGNGRWVPTSEEELQPGQVTTLRCWHVPTAKIDKLREGAAAAEISSDEWKSVNIMNSALGVPDYNFWLWVSGGSGMNWAGFKSIEFSPWGPYCMEDELMAGNTSTGLAPVVEDGLDIDAVTKAYRTKTLVKHFGFNEKEYPDVYQHCPFLLKEQFDAQSSGVVDELAERAASRSTESRIPGSNPQDDNSDDLQEVSSGEEDEELDVRDESEYDPLGTNHEDPVSLSLN